MIKSKKITKNFTIYLLVYMVCTNSYANSEGEESEEVETTTTEVPPEVPEPVEENYDLCDIPYLGGDEPKPVPENLVRMGPNSKYFILVGVDSIPIKEVAEFCETIGLQPAEVRHNVELTSIELFLKESAPENTVVSLGINDEIEEGNFVEYDGTPMRFHSFAERQPNNRMNSESCITVAPHPNLERLVYNDVTCDTGVTPMCMFPPSSQCFLGSPLSLARTKDGFDLVGSTNLRDYFVSFKQYPRAEAADMCQKDGYTLVDFNTGLSNNQIVYDLTKKWLIRNYIFQAIPFWTGGKVSAIDTVNPDVGEAGTPQYKFESSGKMLSDLSEWPSLAWDNEEPSDASGLGLEQCISAILYEPYQASGDNTFSLSTTNCRLPHYALCYQDKNIEPVNVTEAECNDTETEGGMKGRAMGDDDERGPGRFCTIEDVKVNLTQPQLTTDELLTIAAATRHKPLGSDEYRISWALEKEWLSKFTDQIYKVPKEFCPLNYIPPAYMNIMHNMIILYFNSVFSKLRDPDHSAQKFLLEQRDLFEKCAKDLRPAVFESSGGLPTKYKGYSIEPIEELIEDDEKVGKNYIPDMVIDSFWYFFQITVASCWGETQPGGFPSRTYNLQRIHHLFTTYFLAVFEQRWFSATAEVDYGVIVGDMDIDAAYYTMKSCALAAFINSNITELYFPRPVFIPGVTSERLNEKFQDLQGYAPTALNEKEDE